MKNFHEMAEDPQVQHNEMIRRLDHPEVGEYATTGIPVELSGTPGQITSHSPEPGEHIEEILAEFGYSDDEIQSLSENEILSWDG